MDRGAWQAAVYGVTKSWTRLSDSHTHTHTHTHGLAVPLACVPLVVTRSCLPCRPSTLVVLVKHCLSAFPLDGSFQNVSGLLVSEPWLPHC